MKNDELMHWGILGMKWGVRRYQNKDGSLTAAGKKRYGYEDLSNDELRTAIRRKELENRYSNLKSNTGDYKKTKDNLDLAAKSFNTVKSVSSATSKGFELSSKGKKGKIISKLVSDSSDSMSNGLKNYKKEVKPDIDFSKMSDDELRNKVERMDLEQKYNQYYGTGVEKSGKEVATSILDGVGTLAGLAATGLGIALTIKELRS